MSGVGLGGGAWVNSNPLNSGDIMRGQYSMATNADTFTVTGLSIGTTNYVVVITISNVVDTTAKHLHADVTAKTTSGFTFMTEQQTDHVNYKADWIIVKL